MTNEQLLTLRRLVCLDAIKAIGKRFDDVVQMLDDADGHRLTKAIGGRLGDPRVAELPLLAHNTAGAVLIQETGVAMFKAIDSIIAEIPDDALQPLCDELDQWADAADPFDKLADEIAPGFSVSQAQDRYLIEMLSAQLQTANSEN